VHAWENRGKLINQLNCHVAASVLDTTTPAGEPLLQYYTDVAPPPEEMYGAVTWAELGQAAAECGQALGARTPDFATGVDPSTLPAVAAASLLHNDIFAPTMLYPIYGSPQCPSAPEKLTCATAVNLCPTDPLDDSQTPWKRPTAGVLLLPDAMREAMGVAPDVDLKTDKEYTTSYAKDSNAADQRAAWISGESEGAVKYNFPLIRDGCSDSPDPECLLPAFGTGAGFYYPGFQPGVNQDGGKAGGAGCHSRLSSNSIDQTNAYGPGGLNLVSSYSCRCEEKLAGSVPRKDPENDTRQPWAAWVEHAMKFQERFPNVNLSGHLDFDYTPFSNQYTCEAFPSWFWDEAMCWNSDIRSTIALNNAIYFYKDRWSNAMGPYTDYSIPEAEYQRAFQGWTETPMSYATFKEHGNIGFIMLPAGSCSQTGQEDIVQCAQEKFDGFQEDVEDALEMLVNDDSQNIGLGSPVVFARSWRSDDEVDSTAAKWQTFFFCDEFDGEKYSVQVEGSGDDTECRLVAS
jgi:hypothetical protein